MASKEFRFHYVKTPTGAISGQSVLTQTEDAINNLGDYMVEATGDATEALNKATEALNTANTAQQNSAEALSTANSALGSVNTLTATVNTFDGRIKTAESNAANAVTTSTEAANNAAQAVTTANSANKTAQQAVTTANAAKTTAQQASAAATQAVGTANAANATAADAKRIAQQAAAKTSADAAKVSQNAAKASETAAGNSATAANASKTAAATSEQNAANSATAANASKTAAAGSATTASTKASEASASAQKAKDWATKEDGPVEGSGATAKYSAKYYAAQANQSNNVKYVAQTLTATQQTQARANIGAGSAADVTSQGTRLTAVEKKANDNATAITEGLAGKANTSHTHTIANVTNLQTTLDGKIPKTGNRGALAGYSTSAVGTTVNASAKDSQYATSGTVTVKNGATGQAWTKVVKMSAGTITLESNWAWVDGEAPELSFPCLLICHWNNDKGIAGVVKGAA